MAYLQARSGIARSGVTYCGWTPPAVVFYLAGASNNAAIVNNNWTLTMRADGTPPSFTFRTTGVTPVVGQDVKLAYATPNDYLFGGTILQRDATPESPDADAVQWNCTAVGYQWLLDRYDLVLAQYASTGVETIVRDILARFTDGGFTVGYIPASLGNLTITFTFESVWQALQRIAKAVGATVRLSPEKVVDLFVTYPEQALTTLDADAVLHDSLTYREDLTQVRTRTLYQGQGSQAAAAVAAGAATLQVTDVGPFSSSGGYAVSGRSLITYTGLSAGSGAGSLTGCSGILYDIAESDAVDLIVSAVDAGAQTALATILGGGLSGQATNYLQDGRLSASEATARSAADLATFGGALEDVNFAYRRPQRYVRAGMALAVSITDPIAISGTFTIQSVALSHLGTIGATTFEVRQAVQLSSFTRALTDLLRQLRG